MSTTWFTRAGVAVLVGVAAADARAVDPVTSAKMDQVLAALAEVVRDRAQVVATHAIARELEKMVCYTTLELPARTPPDAKAPNAPPRLVVRLGGSKACQGSPDQCRGDDHLVSTCRLLVKARVPVTDPHVLSVVTEETVQLLMRIVAADLNEVAYDAANLKAVASYVFRAAQAVSEGTTTTERLAILSEPTIQLGKDLSPGAERRILGSLGSLEAMTRMEGQLRTKLVEACRRDGYAGLPPCRDLLANTVKWFPEHLTDGGADAACDTFHADQAHRLARFKEWFQDGKLYDKAKDAPCTSNVDATIVDGCMVAQLLVNPTSLAHKARCIDHSPDTARDLVELAHILNERGRHRETMLALGMKEAADAFDEVLEGLGALTLSDVPHQALAYGVDVVGRFLKAYSVDPARAKKWSQDVARDVRTASQSNPRNPVEAILKTASFLPATYAGQPIEFEDLRAAATHFVSLPSLYKHGNVSVLFGKSPAESDEKKLSDIEKVLRLEKEGIVPASFDWSKPATRSIFDSLGALTSIETSPHAAVYVLARELRALADVVRAAAAVPRLKGNEQAMLATAAALDTAGRAIKLGADRKWTELGGVLIDDLSTSMDDLTPIERPVRFVRTILAVYEAPNVQDAKAIFQKSLDDEASRERRFDRLTVDFAAMVGGRWGGERRVNDPSPTLTRPETETSKVYGLYAPAGFQVAIPYVGLLLYPVDLGTYLVKTSQTESTVPRWTEALRFGAALYARPWRTVPIVFGGGVDVQPKIDDHKSYRAQFTVGMELPLFQLR